MGQPAARLGDPTAHGSPLAGSPGSPNVLIGGQPAWRGTTAAAAANLTAQIASGAQEIAIASAIATAAAGTPGAAAAQANLAKTAIDVVARLSSLMASMPGDLFACPVVKVVIPDGPGLVINASQTVSINGMGAARMGDTIQEATSVGAVAGGLPTVLIG